MSKKFRILAVFILPLLMIGALTLLDAILDADPVSWQILLDLLDRGIVVISVISVIWIFFEMKDVRTDQEVLQRDMSLVIVSSKDWRRRSEEHLKGLGLAIQDQFDEWELSPAESDIAGLMLKGSSLKEIAAARSTSEATIRQQTLGIYRKSGLSGRAELSAFFLESLFDYSEINAKENGV